MLFCEIIKNYLINYLRSLRSLIKLFLRRCLEKESNIFRCFKFFVDLNIICHSDCVIKHKLQLK